MTTTNAEDLGLTLRTAYDVFETIRELARSVEDSNPDLFAAFMSAGTAAADGRDALAAAPALAAGTGSGPPAAEPGPGEDAENAAEVIAVLASALASCLADAARQATKAGDRQACQDAAVAARQICHLMVGPDDSHAR
jgi:hypothetical protein